MRMNPVEAVASVFGQYVGFSGRARRSEYWWTQLFFAIVSIVLTFVGIKILQLVVDLLVLLPLLAVGIRRLHDTDRRGWWLLLGLIPIIGTIWLIVWFCQDGTAGPNRFGPSPKGYEGDTGGYGTNPYWQQT
jgi:uncharacterized membrane protein YhaH (DUF805 family)